MSFRSFSHRALAFLVAVVALSLSGRAFAATITLNPVVDRDHFRDTSTIGTTTAFWISRADCLVDDVLHFTTTTTDASSLQLEVWVGLGSADCTLKTNRDPATTAQCLRIFSAPATVAVQQINLRTQDIAQIEQPSPPAPRGQNGSNLNTGTAADCTRTGSTAPDDVTLFFMLIQSTDSVATPATFTTKIDLVGPIAPTNVSALSGNTLVDVSWDVNSDADVAGYTIFCDPPPGTAADAGFTTTATTASTASTTSGGGAGGASGAAGAGGTAGSGDDSGAAGTAGSAGAGGAAGSTAATSTNACGRVVPFVPGDLPSIDVLNARVCGTVAGREATHHQITGLPNFQQVAFSVGANDQVQNVGSLSPIVCATPAPVKGFDFNYAKAGGTAGGSGFCSLRPGALRANGWGSIGGFALILMVWAVRRRSLSRSN